MPGKSNVYTLGEFGVNRVLSPVHLIDGELLAAQNADVPFEKGNRGLRKRSGMVKHNAVAAAGAILSMTNIPIPDPFPDFYVPLITTGDVMYVATTSDGSASSFYQTSEDGITWITNASPITIKPGGPTGGQSLNLALQHGGMLTRTDGTYFLDGVAGHLMRWNGTTLTTLTSNTLADVGMADFAGALEPHLGEVFAVGANGIDMVIARYTGSAWAAVVTVSPWTTVQAAVSANGRLYVPNFTQSIGYWSAATGWIDEGNFTGETSPNSAPVTDMVVTPWGGLVVSIDPSFAASPTLMELRGGTWQDLTAPTDQDGCWGPMALSGSTLYIARSAENAFTGAEVWTYDGTTLALEQDLTAIVTGVNQVFSMVAFNGAVYLVTQGTVDPSKHLIRRSGAGVYTAVISEDGISQDAPRRELGFF